MENLFAYGTLMCDDIMREVCGLGLSSVAATLQGYRRQCVKGECYPALVPHLGSRVDGLVYRDVPRTAWERLDRFEGAMYARETVRVELSDGTVLQAATYVARGEFLDHVEETDWDFADFLRNDKAAFRKRYTGYRML